MSSVVVAMIVSLIAAPRPGRIIIYDGFGTPKSCVVSGRLVEDKKLDAPDAKRQSLANFADNVRTLESDEIIGAELELSVAGKTQRVTTDRDGSFEARFAFEPPLAPAKLELTARVTKNLGHQTPPAKGLIHIVAPGPRTAVISDFDDTIVKTEVVDRAQLLSNTFRKNSAQVELVGGAGAAFTTASDVVDIFFYLSGSPQSFHDRISEVLARGGLPRGPILLKNFGTDKMTKQEAYKLSRIRMIMETFPELDFILIGDTGEKDPEIYKQIARESPQRVRMILIRRAPGGSLDEQRLKGMQLFDDYEPKMIRRCVSID